MIKLFSGTPGSGKSLHTAKEIYDYSTYRKPHLIICNFEVDFSKLRHEDRFLYIDNSCLVRPDLVIDKCKEFASEYGLKEGNVILIIDECQLLFNARSWNEAGRKEWLSFFTQHRKLGCDVILVAQFDQMIDKQIRSLIEYEIIHRKVSNFGFIGGLLHLLTLGKGLFIWVEHWYTVNQKTAQGFFTSRKKYYSLYDTFNTFEK